MHILILPSWYILPHKPLRGVFFKEQAEALADVDHQVGLIHCEGLSLWLYFANKKLSYGTFWSKENGVITLQSYFLRIPKLYALSRLVRTIVGKRLFIKYIKKYGIPDIVHVHSFEAGPLAVWIKNKYGIPFVLTEHSSAFATCQDMSRLNLARNIFEHSSFNIAVSQKFCMLLQQVTGQAFHYISNMVDCSFFAPGKVHSKGCYRFINIAFLYKNKNHSMLIDAFARSFKGHENFSLLIAGSGPEYTALKNQISSLGVEEQVTLYGEATRLEVNNLLQASDCYVHPSRYETFGVALIEAMSCGLPIVSTKCGGPESIIANRKLGILTPIDTDEMADAMLQVIQAHYDRDYIRQYAVDHFSNEAIVQKLEECYTSIIK